MQKFSLCYIHCGPAIYTFNPLTVSSESFAGRHTAVKLIKFLCQYSNRLENGFITLRWKRYGSHNGLLAIKYEDVLFNITALIPLNEVGLIDLQSVPAQNMYLRMLFLLFYKKISVLLLLLLLFPVRVLNYKVFVR